MRTAGVLIGGLGTVWRLAGLFWRIGGGLPGNLGTGLEHYLGWRITWAGVLDRLAYWIGWRIGSAGVLDRLAYWIGWRIGSAGVLDRLAYYMGWRQLAKR